MRTPGAHVARLGLASVFLGHGLVSMLIDRSPGALRLLIGAGLAPAADRHGSNGSTTPPAALALHCALALDPARSRISL